MTIKLTLYVIGGSSRSTRALRNLRRAVEQRGVDVELEVVDLVEDPGRADDDRILATPTLVRREPLPLQRVVGDLSVTSALARILDDERAVSA